VHLFYLAHKIKDKKSGCR